MFRLKVKGGGHVTRTGEEYKKGEVFESEVDLAARMPNHFELVRDADPSPVQEVPQPVVPVAGKKKVEVTVESKPKAAAVQPKLPKTGVDVTKRFPTAVDEDLVVMKRGKFYFVYEPEDEDPINQTGLTKEEVKKCIKEYLGG